MKHTYPKQKPHFRRGKMYYGIIHFHWISEKIELKCYIKHVVQYGSELECEQSHETALGGSSDVISEIKDTNKWTTK